MKIISTAFEPNGNIPEKFTCDGADTNPAFEISDVPEGAKSLVLFMEDPDVSEAGKARLGVEVIDHWVRFNIPVGTKEISEGEEPAGTPGGGTFAQKKYMGPCPPDREHRYFFKLYALDTMLDLPEGSTKADIERAMAGHILEHSELVGRYNRPGNR